MAKLTKQLTNTTPELTTWTPIETALQEQNVGSLLKAMLDHLDQHSTGLNPDKKQYDRNGSYGLLFALLIDTPEGPMQIKGVKGWFDDFMQYAYGIDSADECSTLFQQAAESIRNDGYRIEKVKSWSYFRTPKFQQTGFVRRQSEAETKKSALYGKLLKRIKPTA